MLSCNSFGFVSTIYDDPVALFDFSRLTNSFNNFLTGKIELFICEEIQPDDLIELFQDSLFCYLNVLLDRKETNVIQE